MNNNTKSRFRVALKNFARKRNSTSFEIPKTISGTTDLKNRIQTISIGNAPRKSDKSKPKVCAKGGGGMSLTDQAKFFYGKNYKTT